MTLSIIVPVYKVEQTLTRCLESIARQTFQDWEAILVDDGSPDASPSICDSWALKDPRFRVIHKANGGLSDARNAGIRVAKGEYLTFVDSDDYLDTNTYQQLAEMLLAHPEYDLLEYPFCKVWPDGKEELFQWKPQLFCHGKDYWVEGEAFQHAYAWNKIYRRKLFEQVSYPVGKLFEDVHILPSLIQQTTCIAMTDKGRYYYMQNPDGITARASSEEWESLLDAHLTALDKMQLLASPLKPAETRLYMHLLDIQLYVHALSGKPIILSELDIRQISKHETATRKLKWLMLRLLGLRKLCAIYRVIFKMNPRS
jgi:glycosyltransferase involved in cell wall biosynthesis